MAINKCLQVYHVSHVLVQCGLEDLSLSGKPEVKRLDTMSRDPLATLQKGSEFPLSVQRADGSLRLYWCTEKLPHSMVHWASNYRTVCRCLTISTNVNEGRMKMAVKTKAKKSNNQASFGGSLLKANMEVEAAIQLVHDLPVDETGVQSVCIVLDCQC
jgi:hypothetical protein